MLLEEHQAEHYILQTFQMGDKKILKLPVIIHNRQLHGFKWDFFLAQLKAILMAR